MLVTKSLSVHPCVNDATLIKINLFFPKGPRNRLKNETHHSERGRNLLPHCVNQGLYSCLIYVQAKLCCGTNNLKHGFNFVFSVLSKKKKTKCIFLFLFLFSPLFFFFFIFTPSLHLSILLCRDWIISLTYSFLPVMPFFFLFPANEVNMVFFWGGFLNKSDNCYWNKAL